MKYKLRNVFLLVVALALNSCEDKGEPLTVDDLFEINGLPTDKFSLRLNGFDFETELATGVKTNKSFALTAGNSKARYVLSTTDIKEGVYNGEDNDLKIFLNYTDANNQFFSSTKQGTTSDFKVEIVRFNNTNNTISGNFSGTLISPNSNFELKVENGSFLEVPVDQPFFGEMNAMIDDEPFEAESCIFTSTTAGGFIFETFVGSGNNDSTTLSITVEEMLEEKIYVVNSNNITATYNANVFSTNIFKDKYDVDTGQLNVEEIDSINNRIVGQFNFVVRNAFGEPIDISNGTMNALVK